MSSWCAFCHEGKNDGTGFEKRGESINYADRVTLGNFVVDAYNKSQSSDTMPNDQAPFQAIIRPMSSWMESMPINMSYAKKGVVEVCFGGVFMTTVQRIMDAPVGNWSVLIEGLSRGDNIEEGHFMERLWAGLLAPPIGKEKEKGLMANSVYIERKKENGFLGLIY
jgi:hypothetical protein